MQARFFSAFGPETKEKINWRKTKFPLTCSFQNMILVLAFSDREKLHNSFYLNMFGKV